MRWIFVSCACPGLIPSSLAETTRRRQVVEQVFELGNVQACSVWVVSNQMEATMYKYLATIAGTLAILSGALLVSHRAEAGARATVRSLADAGALTAKPAAIHCDGLGLIALRLRRAVAVFPDRASHSPSAEVVWRHVA